MTGQASDSFAFVRTADREDAPAKLRANDRASGPTSADLELIGMGLCFADHGKFVAPQTSVSCLISPVHDILIVLTKLHRDTLKYPPSAFVQSQKAPSSYLQTQYSMRR
jgi:hypothetical protein